MGKIQKYWEVHDFWDEIAKDKKEKDKPSVKNKVGEKADKESEKENKRKNDLLKEKNISLESIERACKEAAIPFWGCAAIANNEDGTTEYVYFGAGMDEHPADDVSSEMKKSRYYDSSKKFMDDIARYADEWIRRCALRAIPVFISFAVANSEKETKYQTTGIFPEQLSITLNRDIFPDLLFAGSGLPAMYRQGAGEIAVTDQAYSGQENAPVADRKRKLTEPSPLPYRLTEDRFVYYETIRKGGHIYVPYRTSVEDVDVIKTKPKKKGGSH